MADNYQATQGAGTNFRAKEVGGVLYPGLILYDESGAAVTGWGITTGNVAVASLPDVTITTGNVAVASLPGVTITTGNVAVASLPGVTITTGSVAIANIPTVTFSNATVYDEAVDYQLKQVVEQVSGPAWYVPTSNALNTLIVSGQLTTCTAVGTVATVSSVTAVANQTNIGSVAADPVVPSLLNDVWANAVRALFT